MWIRKPVVAGSFYPSNQNDVDRDVDEYLNNAEEQKLDGKLISIISPHAGYVYSAPVAAYSFNQLKHSQSEVAVVLAPSHRARFDGASIIPSGIYETPLGGVEIDSKIGEQLIDKPQFNFIEQAHKAEHSLEVQVPFLQKVLNKFTIVPIVIGSIDIGTCRLMADEIHNILKNEERKFIIIISTDLSHYHSYEGAREMDGKFIDSLKSFDEDNINDVLTGRIAEACGQGPVLTGLMLSKKLGARRVEILKYANSGDTAGPKDQVVGYLSAAILQ